MCLEHLQGHSTGLMLLFGEAYSFPSQSAMLLLVLRTLGRMSAKGTLSLWNDNL